MKTRFSNQAILKLVLASGLGITFGLLLTLDGWNREPIPARWSMGSDKKAIANAKLLAIDEQKSGVKASKSDPVVTGQKRWLALNDKMESAAKTRLKTMSEELKVIDTFLKELRIQSGSTTFADKVTGFDNAWDVFQDETSGRKCIVRDFRNHVLDSRAVVDVAEKMLLDFDKKLTEIDSDLLVECGIDTVYRPTSPSKADLNSFHASVDAAAGNLLGQVRGVWGESVASAGIGLTVGLIAESIMRNSGPKDAYGNPTSGSKITAGAGGMAAGWAAEEAVGKSMTARNNLIRSADELRLQTFDKLKVEEVPGNYWAERAFEIVMRHEVDCENAIADALRVNREWAHANRTRSKASHSGK